MSCVEVIMSTAASAPAVRSFLLTSVGKKYLMGLSGLIWAGFVFVHMAGNLLILISPQAYNAYGHAITSGGVVYLIEALLILALVAHVLCAISLTKENRKARGDQRYAMSPNGDKGVSKASQVMVVHGSILLMFIISHLAGFKYGTYYETTVNGVVMRDLHRLIMECFKQPGFVVWYVIALILLGFHLSHGVKSVFQSLGLRNDKFAPLIEKVSFLYSFVVAAGFIVQPIYVFFIAG